MASFSRKRKRGYRLQVQLAAESHVPCFQERVGTSIPGYMIPDRLPWRPRARPSATLHEIQVRPTNERQSELVPVMIQTERSGVKRKMRPADGHFPTGVNPTGAAFQPEGGISLQPEACGRFLIPTSQVRMTPVTLTRQRGGLSRFNARQYTTANHYPAGTS